METLPEIKSYEGEYLHMPLCHQIKNDWLLLNERFFSDHP